MADYDWKKFTVRININAPAQQLYDAWVTRQNIEKWFLRVSEFRRNETLLESNEPVKLGDKYKWMWYGYPDSGAEFGDILAANGKDFLEFTFAGMNVSVKIISEEGETLVELTQYNIGEDDKSKSSFHVGCTQGWTFYLANLKSLMEGGIDLRNKNEKLKRMMNS